MFSMSRKPLRFSVPILLAGHNSKRFYQVFERFNISTEKNKHSNNNLPRQCVFDGSNYGGTFNVQAHSNFAFEVSGFILNLEKSILSTF